MKYKLVDFEPGEPQEVRTGTCELCFGTRFECNDTFYLEDENGKQYEIESSLWDWGDLFQIEIDNIVRFAEWLEKQEVDDVDGMNWSVLASLVEDYYDEFFPVENEEVEV